MATNWNIVLNAGARAVTRVTFLRSLITSAQENADTTAIAGIYLQDARRVLKDVKQIVASLESEIGGTE